MSDINHYIEAFSNLHTAKIKGHKAPHKAVLLLAIIDLIEEGVISDPCIKLSEELINLKSATIIQYTIKGRFMSR